MSLNLAFALLGLITLFYRFCFISHAGRNVSEKIPREFLQLLAPATFTAIIANSLLGQHGAGPPSEKMWAVAALSLGVAYFSRNVIVTLVFGLGLLYLLQTVAV